MTTEIITKYFPNLSDKQIEQFAMLPSLYADWNSKINVISRKDIDSLMLHHVLHSLAIAKFTTFKAGTKIIDVGTGGGFPGIPLAILYPEVDFFLVDSIGKKIKVVEAVASSLGLENVRCQQIRSEQIREKFDFVVSRAVCLLPDFMKMTRHLVSSKHKNAVMNGVLYLKGGNIRGEIAPLGNSAVVCNIDDYFTEDYFAEKYVVYVAV